MINQPKIRARAVTSTPPVTQTGGGVVVVVVAVADVTEVADVTVDVGAPAMLVATDPLTNGTFLVYAGSS